MKVDQIRFLIPLCFSFLIFHFHSHISFPLPFLSLFPLSSSFLSLFLYSLGYLHRKGKFSHGKILFSFKFFSFLPLSPLKHVYLSFSLDTFFSLINLDDWNITSRIRFSFVSLDFSCSLILNQPFSLSCWDLFPW